MNDGQPNTYFLGSEDKQLNKSASSVSKPYYKLLNYSKSKHIGVILAIKIQGTLVLQYLQVFIQYTLAMYI